MTVSDALEAVVDRLVVKATEGCCRNDAWRGRLCPEHQAFEDGAHATLDALADRPDLLVGWLTETGALERMSWMNDAGTWFCPIPTPTCRVPVFRVVDRSDTA